MSISRELHVLVSFDMESDIGSWTPHHEGVASGTPAILDILARHGIQSTFFFTGDAALACPEALKLVQDAGHEIGCHTLHHESMGEPLFDTPGVLPILPEETANRLTKATELIESACGKRPVSFRAPRGWGSNEMLVTLDRLGYRVDSSYMAYFYGEHLLPYHPSASDWKQPGALKILEVPLFADLTVQSHDPFRRDRDQWPMLRMQGAEALADAILRVAEMRWAQDRPALACLYLHPWEFVEMPRVIQTGEARIEFAEFLWRNCGAAALQALDELVVRLESAGAQFHRLIDFCDIWTERDKALGGDR